MISSSINGIIDINLWFCYLEKNYGRIGYFVALVHNFSHNPTNIIKYCLGCKNAIKLWELNKLSKFCEAIFG